MEKEENGTDTSSSSPPEIEVHTARRSCLGLKGWVIIFSGVLLILGILGTTFITLFIVRRAAVMKLEETVIAATSLALWVAVVLVVGFGLYATFRDSSVLVDAYLWTLLTHWFLDLASTIVLLVVAYQKRDGTAIQAACANNQAHPQDCHQEDFTLHLILLTCGLCIYKLLGAFTCYLIFRFRKELLSFEKIIPLTLRWLRRQSSGASSLSSIFEKKWWSPSDVPTIKIDFASDQSSASDYSNDSAGYRQVAFGVNYPTLSTVPVAMHASNLGVNNGNSLTVHQLPSLPKYSVGS